MNRLQEKYNKEIAPAMQESFGFKNRMAVPRITKVTLNTGIGKYRDEKATTEEIQKDLTLIAGQKAVYTQAKKAIAAFKTRIGQQIGLKVTLRGQKMYDFIDCLISLALPRTRDFRGISEKSVDQSGNLNVGIKEQIIFPEISHENVKAIFSFEINVTTTAKNHKEGFELFRMMGFPMEKIKS